MKISRDYVINSCRNEDFANFILCAIAHISHQKFNEIFKPTDDDFDLSLTFNGVELPIEGIFEEWVEKKKFDEWWTCLLKGQPELDASKIAPPQGNISDLDDVTRATIDKMMYDQEIKEKNGFYK